MEENFNIVFGELAFITNKDFNKLDNRPLYAGKVMTGETNIPEVPSAVSELTNDANYQTGAQVATLIEAETTARENADTALDNRLTTVEGIAGTALQPEAINKVVMTDIAVGANTSTTTFNLEAAKENLLTGETSSKQVSMPVASSTEAGIMNSSTFDAVANNASNINALLNGAVAITGLPADPTQAQLTTAWETATGTTALMNRAGIYDVTNGKVWTYYTNSSTWYSVTNTTQVTINTFTNNSEGTIKGSTNVGQIFAETDGTGSVNGWDALADEVSNNTSDIADLETALGGKQDKLIAGANINIASDGKTISATDTTYTAGSGINISAQNVISTDAPEGFFTLPAKVEGEGSEITLDNTIGAKLDEVQVDGDTYQQTYSGKNLMPMAISDNTTSRANNFKISLPAGTYTISFDLSDIALGSNQSFNIAMTISGAASGGGNYDGNISGTINSTTATRKSFTFTTTADSDVLANSNIRIAQNYWDNGARAKLSNIQIEAGSTATSYEPYTSGPAPNPDYPQEIHIVTGEQTVSISDGNGNTQSYPVSLGTTELCKLGNYQDYIYKDGNDWYIHQEIAKYTFTGTETWSTIPYGTNSWRLVNVILFSFNTNELQIISNIFTGIKHIDRNTAGSNVIYSANNNELNIRNTSLTSLAEVQAATNGNYVYYALATPTDIKITDATLVGQLEALWNAISYNGQTNFVVTASDSGALPAVLEVKAYQKSLNGLLGAIERVNE